MSAIGLEQREREAWPYLRERLREPGRLMALMRGALGDTEVAVVVAVTPEGAVKPLAVLTTAEQIATEIEMEPAVDQRDGEGPGWLRPARVGDYDVQVVLGEEGDDRSQPLAILSTPWIEQHLLLFARTLWRRY